MHLETPRASSQQALDLPHLEGHAARLAHERRHHRRVQAVVLQHPGPPRIITVNAVPPPCRARTGGATAVSSPRPICGCPRCLIPSAAAAGGSSSGLDPLYGKAGHIRFVFDSEAMRAKTLKQQYFVLRWSGPLLWGRRPQTWQEPTPVGVLTS